MLAEMTLAPVMLPPVPPPVVILPTDRLPDTFAYPVIFAPVPDN